MTTLRNLLKKTKKKASKTTDDVLDFDLRKIIFVKFLVRFFFVGLIGGIGLIFPYMFTQASEGRESGVLYLISILGTVIFIAIIRKIIITAEYSGKGRVIAFFIGFILGFVLLVSGALDNI